MQIITKYNQIQTVPLALQAHLYSQFTILHNIYGTEKLVDYELDGMAHDDGIYSTLTLQLITNCTYSLGYGGYILCNLFPSLNGRMEFDKTTDEVILKQIKSAEIQDIIICWGSLKTAKEQISTRPAVILDTLSKLKSKNLFCFSDGKSTQLHPLTPSVRANFQLVPFVFEEKITIKADAKTP